MASVPLIAAGGVVQVGGFVTALHQAATLRREEVPDHPSAAKQAWVLLLRKGERLLVWLKLRRPKTQVVQLAGTIGMRTNMTGRLQVTRGGMPLDERLAQIEKELQELQAKQQQDHAALYTRIEGMGEEVKETWERLEIERKRRLRRSLLRQEAGTWIFMLGVVISTIGAIV